MDTIARIRHFNRYYSAKLGLLDGEDQPAALTLTEMRVLSELAQRTGTRRLERRSGGAAPSEAQERRQVQRRAGSEVEGLTARELAVLLTMDAGYLSRILKRFEARNLITRSPSEKDRRQARLHITLQGREIHRSLDKHWRDQVADQIDPLSSDDREQLVSAMATIEMLLEYRPRQSILIRPHETGDLGWMVESHARVGMEALAARLAADFLERSKPGREACWVAERDGKRLGCLMIVERSEQVAQLRLWMVLPGSRESGLGTMLLKHAQRFARQAGYQKIFLWSPKEMSAARKIYQRLDYRLVEVTTQIVSGQSVEGEGWVLDL